MEKRRINSASSSSSILRSTPKHRWEMALSRQEAGVRQKDFWTHTSNYFQVLAQQNDRFNALNSTELRQKRYRKTRLKLSNLRICYKFTELN